MLAGVMQAPVRVRSALAIASDRQTDVRLTDTDLP